MVSQLITSASNSQIKELLQLKNKPAKRKERELFTIEGKRELELALECGYSVESLFFCKEFISEEAVSKFHIPKVVEVDSQLYSKIAYRGSSEGVVAVAKMKNHSISSLNLSSNPLLLVVEGVEKPGNIGAITRSADAFGVDAIIICEPETDIYNPNVIRSSVGGVFTNQIAIASKEEAFLWLTANHIQIVSAQLQDAVPYNTIDMSGAVALLFGNETRGVTKFWRERAHHRVVIPMRGKLDSLNLSISVAIMCHQAVIERSKKR